MIDSVFNYMQPFFIFKNIKRKNSNSKEKKKMKEKNQMITQTTILAMGWTKTMIKNLLPAPTEKPNPHYKCASPMKLWEEEKVLEIMETDDFKKALEKANKRKNAAKSAIATKEKRLKEKMLEKANNFNIIVIPEDELIENVLNDNKNRIENNLYDYMNYCERKLDNYKSDWFESFDEINEEYEKACLEYENFTFHIPNEETLNRWVVNYIRHNLISYDSTLLDNKGKIGKDEAYLTFKKAVLDRISVIYPKYAVECQRQAESIGVNYYGC